MILKIPLLSANEIVKALYKVGYSYSRQKGSHIVLVNRLSKRIAVIPNRKEVPRGTLRSIIEQAGISPEQFLELLD